MINCNRRDGSARAVNEVAERLADRGHQVHLYARTVEDLALDKVEWHRVPGPGWPELADFWTYHVAVNRMLKRSSSGREPKIGAPPSGTSSPVAADSPPRYDIIHSIGPNTSRANVITIQNVQPAKKKILDRLGHSANVSLPRRLTRSLYLSVTSRAERRLYTARQVPASSHRPQPLFLPVSRGVEQELREHYAIGSARVRVIPNAADTFVFQPVADDVRAKWRCANGLQRDDFLCIFSGGEWTRKGLDVAIRALALIADPKVKLFVAGDDPDRERFRRLASDLQLSGRVIFGGFRTDIALALAASNLYLFPSWYEAFSLATIEAASCGLPIIATKINGAEDFIRPGENGEFIVHEPEQIASVLRPLTSDSATCKRMGMAARQFVERTYTWDRVTDLTEQAYAEHLASGCVH